MGLLDGKRIVITGVLTDASLAFGVAQLAQEEGAEIVLTGAGRGLSLTERTARKLPSPAPTSSSSTSPCPSTSTRCATTWPSDGAASTACSTPSASPRQCASAALHRGHVGRRRRSRCTISAYSLKALADAFAAADDRRRVARRARLRRHASPGRPTTGWASPRRRSSRRRATSPATSGRRASGSTWSPPARCERWPPSRSPASRRFEDVWAERAPLGWDVNDSSRWREGVRRAAVGLVPRDDRRDRPRRRRLPRHRRVTPMPLPR